MNMTPPSPSGCLIERAFKGQLPLWKAFWLVFLPLLLVLYFAYIASLWALLRLNPMADIATFALSFSSIALLLIATAGFIVWRNSGNSTTRAWRYLARVFVAIYFLWYARRAVGLWLVLGPHGI
jgi:hypothetical protein